MITKLLVSASLVLLLFDSVTSTVTYGPAKTILVGDSCSPDGQYECADGLLCEDKICKISDAGACHDTPDLCISGKHCVGKFSNDKKCKSLMPPGGICKKDPYWFCETDLVCENQICKILAGGDCSKFPNGCKEGMNCVGGDGKKICTELVLVDGECDTEPLKSQICTTGLICEQSSCKIPETGTCTGNQNSCASGLNCVEIGEEKQCQKPSPVGGECESNFFKLCATGLICMDNECKIPSMGLCTDNQDACAFGLSCLGTKEEKKCTEPTAVGGECETDLFNFCKSNLVCQKNLCKIPASGACTNNPDECADGLKCVGSDDVKQCTTPSLVGDGCEIDMFSFCEDGLICEENECKIAERSTCTREPNACASGLRCVGANKEKRCKKLMPVGEKCETDPFWFCEDGLICQNRRCRIPSKGLCLHAPSFCVRNTKCVGTETMKKCKKPMSLGEPCGSDPFWVCSDNLVCDDNLCKLPKGSLCTKNPTECLSGTKCVGTDKVKRCKNPVQDGKKCRIDSFSECDEGLKCRNHRCKKHYR